MKIKISEQITERPAGNYYGEPGSETYLALHLHLEKKTADLYIQEDYPSPDATSETWTFYSDPETGYLVEDEDSIRRCAKRLQPLVKSLFNTIYTKGRNDPVDIYHRTLLIKRRATKGKNKSNQISEAIIQTLNESEWVDTSIRVITLHKFLTEMMPESFWKLSNWEVANLWELDPERLWEIEDLYGPLTPPGTLFSPYSDEKELPNVFPYGEHLVIKGDEETFQTLRKDILKWLKYEKGERIGI